VKDLAVAIGAAAALFSVDAREMTPGEIDRMAKKAGRRS